MKVFALFALTMLVSTTAVAEKFNSGDKQIDRWLINIEFVSADKAEEKIKKMSEKFQFDEAKLLELHYELEWSVADLYAGMALKKVSQLSWEEIHLNFNRHRAEGWAAILESLKVDKNSQTFVQFKSLVGEGAPKEDLEADSRNVFKQKK